MREEDEDDEEEARVMATDWKPEKDCEEFQETHQDFTPCCLCPFPFLFPKNTT